MAHRNSHHHRTDHLTITYMTLRKAGTPSFVTSHEAYRMTEGRVGTKGDHNLRHGFSLMALVKKADGEVKVIDTDPADCDHEERVSILGLSIDTCMDCGQMFIPEQATSQLA